MGGANSASVTNQRERRTSDQKKYFNSSELGVLSTTANSNLGSVDTGAAGAVREEQKQEFDKNQNSGLVIHKNHQ